MWFVVYSGWPEVMKSSGKGNFVGFSSRNRPKTT